MIIDLRRESGQSAQKILHIDSDTDVGSTIENHGGDVEEAVVYSNLSPCSPPWAIFLFYL